MIQNIIEKNKPHPLLETTKRLAPQIEQYALNLENSYCLPDPLFHLLSENGMFSLTLPAAFNGYELDPVSLIEILEELSCADGSVGWSCAVSTAAPHIIAQMGENVFRDIFSSPQKTLVSITFAPNGKALKKENGYHISGNWHWCTGIQHANWVIVNCQVSQESQSTQLPTKFFLVPKKYVTVIETWDAHGLKGTGSHQIIIDNAIVPEHHSVNIFAATPRISGHLYHYPFTGIGAIGAAAVALGIARAAIQTFEEGLNKGTTLANGWMPKNTTTTQIQLAKAKAMWQSAKAGLVFSTEETWKKVTTNRSLSLKEKASIRLSSTYAANAASNVTNLIYNMGGGGAVFNSNPLQRYFRDVNVVTHHAGVSSESFEQIGKVLLGVVNHDPRI